MLPLPPQREVWSGADVTKDSGDFLVEDFSGRLSLLRWTESPAVLVGEQAIPSLDSPATPVPVTAYPVTGPIDVVADGVTGILSEDLRSAALAALNLDPQACRAHALGYSWEACTRQFVSALVRPRMPGSVCEAP